MSLIDFAKFDVIAFENALPAPRTSPPLLASSTNVLCAGTLSSRSPWFATFPLPHKLTY